MVGGGVGRSGLDRVQSFGHPYGGADAQRQATQRQSLQRKHGCRRPGGSTAVRPRRGSRTDSGRSGACGGSTPPRRQNLSLDGSGWRPSAITAGYGSAWAAVPALTGVWRLRTDSGYAMPLVIDTPDRLAGHDRGRRRRRLGRGLRGRNGVAVDPATNTPDDPISVGSRIGGISAAAGGGVWVATTADDASAAPGTLAFESRGNLYVQRPGGEARQITKTSHGRE